MTRIAQGLGLIVIITTAGGCGLIRPATLIERRVELVPVRVPVPERTASVVFSLRDTVELSTPELGVRLERIPAPADSAPRYRLQVRVPADTLPALAPRITEIRTVRTKPGMAHNMTWAAYGAGAMLLMVVLLLIAIIARR